MPPLNGYAGSQNIKTIIDYCSSEGVFVSNLSVKIQNVGPYRGLCLERQDWGRFRFLNAVDSLSLGILVTESSKSLLKKKCVYINVTVEFCWLIHNPNAHDTLLNILKYTGFCLTKHSHKQSGGFPPDTLYESDFE